MYTVEFLFEFRLISIGNLPSNVSKRFSICTFNVLAPCYKRLTSENERESSSEKLWRDRQSSIIGLLDSLRIDIICLQEFWFGSQSFVDLYRSAFQSNYSFYYLQRKNPTDDGLAVFVRNQHFKVVESCHLILNDVGNRVGLLLNLDFHGRTILLLNLHLTFPHHRFERHVRWKQIRKLLNLVDEYKMTKKLSTSCTVIVCGDFNSSSMSDPVYQLVSRQYRSSYLSVHGSEPSVTHLTHRDEQLAVDFIFYKSDCFVPIESHLIPDGCDPSNWFDHTNWNLSDHRPLLSTFQWNR